MARQNQLDASRYNTLVGFDGDWRDSWWNQDYLEMTANRLRLPQVERVLDLGCGVGHWGLRLLPLCSPTATLLGVDREDSFVARARTKAEDRGMASRARFEVAHGEDLLDKYGPDSFDMVTCQTVLMHVHDAATVLTQMLAVLRPGGVILVSEPDNSTNTVATVAAEQRDHADLLAALELQLVCREGKRRLGHGDDDVGNRLVALFHGAGLAQIDCRSNDRCAFMIPPYTAPRQALELSNSTMTGVDDRRALLRSRYLAGGGDQARFESLWAAELRTFAARVQAIERQEFVSGGGFMLYLVSGHKPRP